MKYAFGAGLSALAFLIICVIAFFTQKHGAAVPSFLLGLLTVIDLMALVVLCIGIKSLAYPEIEVGLPGVYDPAWFKPVD